MAGITTFMTMAYILIVNPNILSATGMDKGAVFTATAISAAIATFAMAYGKLSSCIGFRYGTKRLFCICCCTKVLWQIALTAILLKVLFLFC